MHNFLFSGIHLFGSASKHCATLYHCSDSPFPKEISPRPNLGQVRPCRLGIHTCKWTLASLIQYLAPTWEPFIMHCLFVWLICSNSRKRGHNDPINQYWKDHYSKLYDKSNMHLRQIWEIPKITHVHPQIYKSGVDPQKGRRKIEVSVLPKMLLLKLRSSSHC